MKQYRHFIVLLVSSVLASCAAKIVPQQVQGYIDNPKNGLTVADTLGNLRLSCTYIPNQYCAWIESQISGEKYSQVKKDMQGLQFFEIRLSDSTGERDFLRMNDDPSQYHKRLDYLLNGIGSDVYLTEGQDTLPCLQHHFERTYSLLPYNKVLLTFKSTDSKSYTDKKLIIVDRSEAGNPLLLTFKASSFSRLPKIKSKTAA